MTKTYTQVMRQIEDLKRDAERLRMKEVEGVIGRIRQAISAYDLSAEDLGFAGKGKSAGNAAGAAKEPVRRRKRGMAKAAKAPAVVKFANGSGGTWGGRGKRPQWLRDALGAGKSLNDFLVK